MHTTPSAPRWTVAAVDVTDPTAVAIRREYLADVIASYWGRPATAAEVDAEDTGDAALAPPTGAFLVGSADGTDAGCAGVVLVEPGVAELKRLYVRPPLRGTGGGAALLAAAEAGALALGARRIRLDTRLDLAAARALYARRGYRDIAPFTDDPFAQVFLGKTF
ncbi:GNAT family N-acetyltransferase [Actinokineospora guangxiensis]|uniref:GNAT family N-acetyltransferase n=1 Tax=Actinokineospora guangxiensis TaxID=1490288 RepID=A0ABW0EVF7_9PSEU